MCAAAHSARIDNMPAGLSDSLIEVGFLSSLNASSSSYIC